MQEMNERRGGRRMIAVKGEMPKNCSECSFKANDYVCGLLDCAFSCNHFTERNYNCPLVEIVTCKDCKHYKHHGTNGYCSKRVNTDSHTDVYREPNYFCALGERRE